MFRRLFTLDEARQVVKRHFKPKPLGVEEIPLLEAHSRVLAEDVTSALDIPPFSRSTVDGYALKAGDTFGAEENLPKRLRVCGIVNVGEPPSAKVVHGEAVEIVTGAPIPEGADAVVMVEYTERRNDEIYIYSAVAKDENIMKIGSDIRKGERVLRMGQFLSSREIGILAALGMATVKVYSVPRIAVLSTGAEVTEPGRDLPLGKIYDINAYSLSAAVLENGGKPVYLGVVPDDKLELLKALERALSTADMVITSGGVSVGPKDAMPQTLDSLGKPGILVSGIAIKPGKPTTIALINGKPLFSLPGHPASALMAFHLLVGPTIQLMAGRKVKRTLKVKAFAAMRMFPARGRRTFITVKLKRDNSNRLMAVPVPAGLSGAITTISKADGYVEIEEDQQFIDADEEVTVHLLKN